MKRIILLALCLTLFGGTDTAAQEKLMDFWSTRVVPTLSKINSISFDVKTYDLPNIMHVELSDGMIYASDSNSTYIEIGDTIYFFDHTCGDVLYGYSRPDTNDGVRIYNDMAFYLKHNALHSMHEEMPFYFENGDAGSFDYPFVACDARGDTFVFLTDTVLSAYIIDRKTGEYIPIYDTITINVDKETALVTQVNINSSKKNHNVILKVQNIDTGTVLDIPRRLDECKRRYERYDMWNINEQLPFSMVSYMDKQRDFKETLFGFPIVNLEHDTVTLNEIDGWVLLCFWSYGCKPCYMELRKFQKEKEKDGKYTLEQAGIKTMFVNDYSNITEAFKKVADRFDAHEILYSAKGIGKHINVPTTPMAFLVTPDKKVIELKEDLLESYDEIFQIVNSSSHNKKH